MYSSFVRLQNVFGFFTTVVTIVGCLIAATDLLHARTPSATVRPAGLQVYVEKGRSARRGQAASCASVQSCR